MSNSFPLIDSVNPFDQVIKYADRTSCEINSGVYAVCYLKGAHFCDVLYVGASIQLARRFKCAWRDKIYLNAMINSLDKSRFCIKVKAINAKSAEELGQYEQAYIDWLKPMLNDRTRRAYYKSAKTDDFFNSVKSA